MINAVAAKRPSLAFEPVEFPTISGDYHAKALLGSAPKAGYTEIVQMKILGAIIAGGKARRFGSDKAHAVLEGKRMIDKVAEAVLVQSQQLVICGRDEPGFDCIADRPEADMGPLGGINAALHHAAVHGFDAVLSAGCDIPNLPVDLASHLAGSGAAIVADQPVVGLWPAELAAMLDQYLAAGERRIYGFAKKVGAREIELDPPLLNINRPQDLPT